MQVSRKMVLTAASVIALAAGAVAIAQQGQVAPTQPPATTQTATPTTAPMETIVDQGQAPTVEQVAPEETAPQPVVAAPLAFGELSFRTVSRAYLAETFPELRQRIESPDELEAPFGEETKIATYRDAETNVDYLFLYHDTGNWCSPTTGCVLDLYVNNNGSGMRMIHSVRATLPVSIHRADDMVSLLTCNPQGQQTLWTMQDGALNKPLDINSFGYFDHKGTVSTPPAGLPGCRTR